MKGRLSKRKVAVYTMERKLGIQSSNLLARPEIENLHALKDHGFESFFTGTIDVKEVCKLKNEADKLGLHFDHVHAPFMGINELWGPGLSFVQYDLMKRIKQTIDAAYESGVNRIVLHVQGGPSTPRLCDIGFARFDEIITYALDRGVYVAIENLRRLGPVACLMERYERFKEVGFCYDTGHEICYTSGIHFLDCFGSRLLSTHIHDNHGIKDEDEHLLPFDGIFDYQDMMNRINACGYDQVLSLEVCKGSRYKDMTDDQFLDTAYERILKISKM